uniref:Uncharacterized protein n=1 Tax=Salix viminalis TaxID=40686 RepID=A0A6N2KQP5_SALVM
MLERATTPHSPPRYIKRPNTFSNDHEAFFVCLQTSTASCEFSRGAQHETFFRRKDKVVFVLGPTGTGKSRLAIDLATHFPAEVVNCDKMQVYKGLDIVTNKVTEEECRGVPHHLLGIADPDADFTSEDFRHHASLVVESIVTRDRLPIIAADPIRLIDEVRNVFDPTKFDDYHKESSGNWGS